MSSMDATFSSTLTMTMTTTTTVLPHDWRRHVLLTLGTRTRHEHHHSASVHKTQAPARVRIRLQLRSPPQSPLVPNVRAWRQFILRDWPMHPLVDHPLYRCTAMHARATHYGQCVLNGELLQRLPVDLIQLIGEFATRVPIAPVFPGWQPHNVLMHDYQWLVSYGNGVRTLPLTSFACVRGTSDDRECTLPNPRFVDCESADQRTCCSVMQYSSYAQGKLLTEPLRFTLNVFVCTVCHALLPIRNGLDYRLTISFTCAWCRCPMPND